MDTHTVLQKSKEFDVAYVWDCNSIDRSQADAIQKNFKRILWGDGDCSYQSYFNKREDDPNRIVFINGALIKKNEWTNLRGN